MIKGTLDAADLSGVALSFFRTKSVNLFRADHEEVIYMFPDETYSARWMLSDKVVQKATLVACGAERLLTRRKQDCYLRLSTHLGVLLVCFLNSFVLGK